MDNSSQKSWEEHCGTLLNSVNGFDVIDCQVCRFKHIVPVPTDEELKDIYKEDYYTIEKPLYIERTQMDLDWWNIVYAERYDMFEQQLGAKGRIFEIGSGSGYFLLHGKKRGWECVGIEPSKQAAEHSRQLGLDVIEDFVCKGRIGELGCFDVVYMHQVLEHIPDPKEMLETAALLLKQGGIVCVIVPNDYNPFQEVLAKHCNFLPWWIAPPHHINYFDFSSLKSLTERVGFEIIETEGTFPLELFLLMGDNYIGNDTLGRACHGKRMVFEKTLAQAGLTQKKLQLYRALADCGLGREIVLYARKENNN